MSAPTRSRKRRPDGYTILLTTSGHAASPALYRTLPFDAAKDFAPVTPGGFVNAGAGRQSRPAGDVNRGTDRLRQGRTGGLNYGFERPWHAAASRRWRCSRAPPASTSSAHPLSSGDAPLAHRRHRRRRAGRASCRWRRALAAHQGRHRCARSAWRRRQALAGAAGRADRRGERGSPGFESPERGNGCFVPARHAARHRRAPPARRSPRRWRRPRSVEPHPRRRQRAGRQHAGRVRRECSRPTSRSSPRS